MLAKSKLRLVHGWTVTIAFNPNSGGGWKCPHLVDHPKTPKPPDPFFHGEIAIWKKCRHDQPPDHKG